MKKILNAQQKIVLQNAQDAQNKVDLKPQELTQIGNSLRSAEVEEAIVKDKATIAQKPITIPDVTQPEPQTQTSSNTANKSTEKKTKNSTWTASDVAGLINSGASIVDNVTGIWRGRTDAETAAANSAAVIAAQQAQAEMEKQKTTRTITAVVIVAVVLIVVLVIFKKK